MVVLSFERLNFVEDQKSSVGDAVFSISIVHNNTKLRFTFNKNLAEPLTNQTCFVASIVSSNGN